MSSDVLPESTVDFKEYLAVLKRRRWVIFLTYAVVLAAVTLYSLRQTPIYAASSTVVVRPQTTNVFERGVDANRTINMVTERQIAASGEVADRARQLLNVPTSAQDLRRKVSVEGVEESQTLSFSFRDPRPDFAQRGAQAFADAYLGFRYDQAAEQASGVARSFQSRLTELEGRYNALTERINALPSGSAERLGAESERSVLSSQIQNLRTQLTSLAGLDFKGGQVIERPVLPTDPVSPNHPRNILAGTLAGLLLGVALAFLRDRLDDRLTVQADANRYLGYPVLATVPRQPRRANERIAVADPDSLAADAYRRLRSSVLFLMAKENAKVVVVSSAFAGDGKTTTAANLALAMTHLGKRVLLVSADLRRPTLHRLFGLRNEAGLSEVLIGLADVEDVVQRVPGVEGLEVLTSGGETERPAELLQDEPLRRLLEEQRERVDVVIIDSSPVLAVADTLSLASLADGVVMVVDSTSTTRQTLREAAEQLDQVGARIIGVVVNKAQPSKRPRYTSTYGQDDGAEAGRVGAVRMDGRALEQPQQPTTQQPTARPAADDAVGDGVGLYPVGEHEARR